MRPEGGSDRRKLSWAQLLIPIAVAALAPPIVLALMQRSQRHTETSARSARDVIGAPGAPSIVPGAPVPDASSAGVDKAPAAASSSTAEPALIANTVDIRRWKSYEETDSGVHWMAALGECRDHYSNGTCLSSSPSVCRTAWEGCHCVVRAIVGPHAPLPECAVSYSYVRRPGE
jgi:hypothetical protein